MAVKELAATKAARGDPAVDVAGAGAVEAVSAVVGARALAEPLL